MSSSPLIRMNRGQARAWLKWAATSDVLDRLPPGSPEGPTGSARSYARALLDELSNPESARRPVAAAIADAEQFRAWVEGRQKFARRVILAERRPGGPPAEDLAARAAAQYPSEPRRTGARAEPVPPPFRPAPRLDPLWDDELDGADPAVPRDCNKRW